MSTAVVFILRGSCKANLTGAYYFTGSKLLWLQVRTFTGSCRMGTLCLIPFWIGVSKKFSDMQNLSVVSC